MTMDEIKLAAERVGISLSEDEAAKLLKGLERASRMAEVTRGYVTPDVEPATIFRVREKD